MIDCTFLQVTLREGDVPYLHGLTFLTFRMQELHFALTKSLFGRELRRFSAGFVPVIASGVQANIPRPA